MTQQHIQRIVIVGGGTAGWMAAAVFAHLMGRQLDVALVESDQIGTVGVGEATIPQIRLFTQLLGIDEDELLKASFGTFKAGIRFNGWGREGESYIHAFGQFGRDVGKLRFHQHWLRHRLAGGAHDFWRFSLNAQAANANRFARLKRIGNSPLEGTVHAFHFDASAFAVFLRGFCETRGVTRHEGRIVDTTLRGDDGFIESVTLEDGRHIGGDLFIDCSGFRALLIGQALGADFEDWTHWLPCDRAIAVPTASEGPLLPYTQASARAAGWQWRIPLQHRTGNGHVYCSEHMSEDEATAVLLAGLDETPLAEPRPLEFRTGHRREFWKRNCVALGLAGGFMEPLESTSIHLIQSGLDRLLALFPDHGFDSDTICEYNRQCTLEYERIRDFLILHYHLNQRDEPFWRERRKVAIPARLARRMALFRRHGRVFREDEELFTDIAWVQVMLGQNLLPSSCDPRTVMLSDDQLEKMLANLATIIDSGVTALPDHADYVARVCRSAPRRSLA